MIVSLDDMATARLNALTLIICFVVSDISPAVQMSP